jgi:type IV pilus assembly protein PilP
MYKAILIHVKIVCIFSIMVFIFGCDSPTEPPQAPKVITQKIAVNTPAQPAPAQSTEQPPPAPKQQSGPVQQTPPVKPEIPSKAIQPVPVAEKKMAAAQPDPVTAPPPAKQPADFGKKPEKGAPASPPQDRAVDKATDKPAPGILKDAPQAAETGALVSDAKAVETDLERMKADALGGYSPAGKVDPFQPLFEEKPAVPEDTDAAEKQKTKRRMPLTPLERVDLSQLKLVGVIQAPSGNKALVEEASGKGYIIKKGTFIGIHAGRVLEIQKDRVVVEEEVENVLGQYTLEKKELKLQKPPGEF